MKKAYRELTAALLLVLTAIIWGVAFVAQQVGSGSVGPFTFLVSRSLLAGVALFPLVRIRRAKIEREARRADLRAALLGGIACGAALMIASVLQQIGIAETTVGKAGFITALYIVIVPILGVFLRRRIPVTVWIGVALATVGMYLLCIRDGLTLSRGDLLILLCAACFSVQILLVDHFSRHADGVTLAMVQFLACGAFSAVGMLCFETPTWTAISEAWLPILYTGLFSSGIGYTLQILAQRDLPPTLASLIMSLESVFSALAGWLFLRQSLTLREGVGCVLMFVAILVAQLSPRSVLAWLRTRKKSGRNL